MGSQRLSYCFEIKCIIGTSKTPLKVGRKGECRDSPLMYLTVKGWNSDELLSLQSEAMVEMVERYFFTTLTDKEF